MGRRDKKPHPHYCLTVPEHNLSNKQEKIRIYNSRGEIRVSPIGKKIRIYVRARMYPGLSVSRSLGDILAHHIGVTTYPCTKVHNLTNNDRFFVIATDCNLEHSWPRRRDQHRERLRHAILARRLNPLSRICLNLTRRLSLLSQIIERLLIHFILPPNSHLIIN